MFETFEHTADLGLRIEAASLPELFADAARGLTSVLVDNIEAIQPRDEEIIELSGLELDYLLFDWLNELLFRFESRQKLYRDFEVHLTDGQLRAIVRGETCDPTRHRLAHEVKAITYHELRVEQTNGVWRAELIVDI